MDDVTDTVFRQIVASIAAPDLFFTEFTNVDGLQSPGRPRVLEKLRFAASELTGERLSVEGERIRVAAGR